MNELQKQAEQGITDNKATKRAYVKKEKPKALTHVEISEIIKEKELELKAMQSKIDKLSAERNRLFFIESEKLGLVALATNPDKFKYLATLVDKCEGMKVTQQDEN